MGCMGSKTAGQPAAEVTTAPEAPAVQVQPPEAAAAKEETLQEPVAPPAKGPETPLRVTIVSARGLRNADWAGKSDPYCVCEVVGRPECKFQTVVVEDHLEPEWNHKFDVTGYCANEDLEFTVKDKDPLKPDDDLGRATLAWGMFAEAGFDGEVPLTGSGAIEGAMLKLKVVVNPALEEEQQAAPVEADTGAAEREPVKEEPILDASVAPKRGMCC